jgi:hypothetical protein
MCVCVCVCGGRCVKSSCVVRQNYLGTAYVCVCVCVWVGGCVIMHTALVAHTSCSGVGRSVWRCRAALGLGLGLGLARLWRCPGSRFGGVGVVGVGWCVVGAWQHVLPGAWCVVRRGNVHILNVPHINNRPLKASL